MFQVPDPATEIFRQIKANFNSDDALATLSLPSRRSPGGKAKHFRPTLEKLAEDRERRKQLKKSGFFSVAGQAYNPVGRIQLDMKELVYSQLGIQHVATKTFGKSRLLVRIKARLDENSAKQRASSELNQQAVETSKPDDIVCENRDYESTRLLRKLDDSERHAVEARAGRPWADCIKESEKKFGEVSDEHHAIDHGVSREWRQGGHHHHYHHHHRPSMFKTALLLSRLGMKSATNRSRLQMATVEIEDPTIAADLERKKALKRQEQFVDKLHAMYHIVCCVCNMKQRDLRTKFPLNVDSLRHLQRDLQQGADGKLRPPLSFQPSLTVSDLSTLLPVKNVIAAATGIGRETDSAKRSQQTQDRVDSGMASAFRRSRSSRLVSVMINRQSFKSLSSTSPKQSKVQTWDDLLAALDQSGQINMTSKSPVPRRNISTMARSWVTNTQRDPNLKRRDNDNLPLWQKLMLPPEEDEDVKTPPLKAGKTEEHLSADGRLFKLKKKYEAVRNKSERHLRTQLDRSERESKELFYSKLEMLDIFPTWDNATVVATMRAEAHHELNSRRKRRDKSANKSSKWVIGLEKEFMALFLSDLESEETEKLLDAGRAVLQKLKMIAREHLTDIPYAKAKLCLLVYSLPARQICTKAMADAFQFSLQHVFCCSPSLYEEWMKLRKLPFPFTVSYRCV